MAAISHAIGHGFEFYRDEYDTEKTEIDLTGGTSAPITPGVPDGTYYQNWSLYAQDEVQLWKDAEAIAGIRYSNFESEGEVGATQLSFSTDAVVGNLNLRFGITPHTSIWSVVWRGVSAHRISRTSSVASISLTRSRTRSWNPKKFSIAADSVLAYNPHWSGALIGVALWGLHMGMTQGLLAAMVADTVPADLCGTAFGFLNLASGVAMLIANGLASPL
jgi:hypothetical protein